VVLINERLTPPISSLLAFYLSGKIFRPLPYIRALLKNGKAVIKTFETGLK